ncbi:hypothetical protein [Thermomonospora cellulosilytica]|uniref:Uncharacterized protein n=1 Tax=Thermomonospora cellulosilytica TaxID=1411118 RepID=A0A7W3N414_9ACTN|nr:hypothetical protein [Thermomonospora cellulosilytica]MBA9007042.1 hypothetical protein [Thermomonospora cellulosilytica]
MPRIAISGHRGLPPATERLIDQALRAVLAETGPGITGLSCLADGADQIFARAVLDHGGALEAIVPAERYREGLPPEAHAEYDRLLAAAVRVHRLPHVDSEPRAHMAASEHMLGLADELWAVWDGKPARGFGGTADVVARARGLGVPVRVFWPSGARRG